MQTRIRRIGYKFRIYPTEEQKVFFERHFGCSRFIYNYLLALREAAYKKFKIKISGFEAKKEISKLKKQEEYQWLKEVNSQSLQESAIDLEKAYRRFFKKLGSKPRFKKKLNKQQFKIPQYFNLYVSKNENYFLEIPKLKSTIRVNVHREIEGTIKQATIARSASGDYFVSFNCEIKEEVPCLLKTSNNHEIGIDLGLTSFITTSDGGKKEAPKFLRKLERHLKSAQKSLSRKEKRSSNWYKAKKQVAVVHENISNHRKDFLHKLSSELVNENQVIYLEDLNVKGMMRNRYLSKSIADASWGEFTRQLTYKASWRYKKVAQIGRFEPSSKLCSRCNTINKELRLCDRRWKCKSCLSIHDRDINAAKNILKIGQGMPECKSVEKSTSIFSFKKKQVGSVKQEPVSKC